MFNYLERTLKATTKITIPVRVTSNCTNNNKVESAQFRVNAKLRHTVIHT